MKRLSDIADVVELWIWAEEEDMTIGDLKEALEQGVEVSELEDDDSEDDWAQDMAQHVVDEISNREQRLGSAYPFSSDGNRIRLTSQDGARFTYLFCLGLSLFPAADIENEQRGLQFEGVAMAAAGNFFSGQTVRIGAPWRTAEFPTYGHLLDRVVELVPELGARTRSEAPDGGDAGWDFIVVKGFADQEFPRIIAFGNCATGRTDWLKKGVESQLGLFLSFFSHHHKSVVIELFAVPFSMTRDDRLKKCGPQTITLDRHRICEHLPIAAPDCVAWMNGSKSIASNLSLV